MPYSSKPSRITPGEFSPATTASYDIGIDKTSDSAIFRSGYDTKDIISDTVILRPAIAIMELISDSATFVEGYDTKQKISDSRIKKTKEIDYITDSVIRILDQEININSDSRVKTLYDLTKVSVSNIHVDGAGGINIIGDSRIKNTDDFFKLSNSRILREGFGNISILNDSHIKVTGVVVNKFSDSAIFRPAYGLNQLTSDTRIKRLDIILPILINSRILVSDILTQTTNTRIKTLGQIRLKLSDVTMNIYRNPIIASFNAANKIRVNFERISRFGAFMTRVISERSIDDVKNPSDSDLQVIPTVSINYEKVDGITVNHEISNKIGIEFIRIVAEENE